MNIKFFSGPDQFKRVFLILFSSLLVTLVRYRLQYGFFIGESVPNFLAGWLMHLFVFVIVGGFSAALYSTYAKVLLRKDPPEMGELLKEIFVIQSFIVIVASILILGLIYQVFGSGDYDDQY